MKFFLSFAACLLRPIDVYFLHLLVKHNALKFLFSPFVQFFFFFWNIREFGAKNFFTDHQTANTIQLLGAIKEKFSGLFFF